MSINPTRLTAPTAWLVAGALTLLGTLAPAGYFALGYMMERGMAQSTAKLTAKQVTRLVTQNPDYWRFEVRRLGTLIATGDAERDAVSDLGDRTLLNADGTLLLRDESVPALLRPVVARRVPLYESDQIVGYVQVERSLRALVWRTVGVAIASTLLALLLFAVLHRRPLRALRFAEQRLYELAHRDALTGLPNRATFRHMLSDAIAMHSVAGRMVAVLFFDLDRFKRINDTLGHQAGDALLNAVARRVRETLRTDDLLARLSGDEFALIVRDVGRPEDAAAVADKIIAALAGPLPIDGRDIYMTPSIGIALAPLHAGASETLIKCADTAMYAAKRQGGGRYRFYDASMTAGTAESLELDRQLREALRKDEFRLQFQPIVVPGTGHIIGAEALLRWHSAERGIVSPADFVPMLEETGLIVPVGEWVLHEACRQARAWIALGGAEFVLSVNVSPRQFKEGDIVEVVSRALSASDFPGAQLQLEVTEGLLMDATTSSLQTIERLASLGVRVAVDDFGIGYSSLAYLKRFRLHSLKIDRTFVREMADKAEDATIVRAVTALAHNLGLSVTAEGVETEAQRALVHGFGCDYAQGYLFAKPMAPAQIEGLLARQASHTEERAVA